LHGVAICCAAGTRHQALTRSMQQPLTIWP